MNGTRLAVAGLALLVAGGRSSAARAEAPPNAAASIVKLLVQKSAFVAEGGGFVVGDGLIVTNRHVVHGAVRGEVVLTDQRRFDVGEVVATDRYWDLALLRVDAPPGTLTPLPMATDVPDAGTEVATCVQLRFSDDFEGDEEAPRPIEVRRGTLTRHRALEREGVLLRTTVEFEQGDSGSPLFDATFGHVVGVLALYSLETSGAAASFAIPARYVAALVERAEGAPPFAESLFHWHRATVTDPEWMIEAAASVREHPRPSRTRMARSMLKGLLDKHGDDDPPTLAREAYYEYALCFLLEAVEADAEVDDPDVTVHPDAVPLYTGAARAFRVAIDTPPLTCFDDVVLSLSLYQGASCSYRIDEVETARALIDRFVAREPEDPDGHHLRGLIALGEGDVEAARTSLAALVGLLGEDDEEVVELREMLSWFEDD